MTYFGFLAEFLVIPLVILSIYTWIEFSRGVYISGKLINWHPGLALLLHVIIAVVYTTPWDNYLVATGVWFYNPALVTGLTIGWVPVEEYTFFILQTLLSGLWFYYLARKIAVPDIFQPAILWKRLIILLPFGILWFWAVSAFFLGPDSLTYLSIILAWALPPIMLQILFGADILWHYRRPVALSLITITLYLAITDSLAIRSGTWTIAPDQSTGILIAHVLPVEEMIFFFVTNVLIVFGILLLLALESRQRVDNIRTMIASIRGLPAPQSEYDPARTDR
jgi:lycopene beta-cyclase